MLADATRCGPFSGGFSGFFRPRSIVAERVMLVGDAANQADPLNGGGIHKAMESAYCAAEACRHALAHGDFSRGAMQALRRPLEPSLRVRLADGRDLHVDRQEPGPEGFLLFLLRQVGKLTAADPRFRDFAGGVFSGVIAQSSWLCRALCTMPSRKIPALGGPSGKQRPRSEPRRRHRIHCALAYGALATSASAGLGMMRNPARNLGWGMDLATKAALLAQRQVAGTTHGRT